MTGFGDAAEQIGGIHYFLEIRSLNSKYFKAVIRLPEEFQGLEAEMETELRHRLRRGSVFVSARITDISENAAHDINASALSHYVDQLRKSRHVSGGDVKLDIGALLSLPGVLQPPADEEQRIERARSAFLSLLERACGSLIQMREREGLLLLQDLHRNRDLIAAKLRVVAQRAPQVVAEYEKRLKHRISTMLAEAGLTADPIEIVREVAIVAERSDIAEEVQRLSGHIEQFTELLDRKEGEPVGRTLDFLAQEMLREANTIASKSGDTEIARAIVEVKGAIDRIKEQVQNIE